MNYIFYLDSYSCFFEKEGLFFVYNTLNGKWANCSVTSERRDLFSPFIEGLNYSVFLSEKLIQECELAQFIQAVGDNFSGELIPAEETAVTPFVFPSLLDFKYEMKKQDKKERMIGHEIYENLKELHLFLHSRPKCNKELIIPEQLFYSENEPAIATDWEAASLPVFMNLNSSWSGNLHVWCRRFNSELWNSLKETLSSVSLHKVIHTGVDSCVPSPNGCFKEDGFSFVVYVTDQSDEDSIDQWLVLQSEDERSVEFQWLICSVEEWEKAVKLIDQKQMERVRLVPYYNGMNRSFFEQNIYVTDEDLSYRISSKNDIFARQTLNTNFFGKLYLFPDGTLYAHPAEEPLGVVPDLSLSELIFKELSEGKSWLNVRSRKPCASCRYQWICPSPSDYERVLEIPNLCDLRRAE